ncbi:collectin-10 isoform X2 [Poeciliopsis prolifica]|uniref:collectin-10 isoform X2 n=1 Tax=Poeciliopsis prolifica TaxID=188132 RepID=UPI002413B356|nr:collectin-10 isoform X2 [Poeciliopsis prolifica]
MSRLLRLFVFLSGFCYIFASPEVCTNSLIPGAKGDQGDAGEQGEEGKLGKNGPPGLAGDKGPKGFDGPAGLKGQTGATCDCGRYRKVVGQLDENLGKLRNTVKFVKSVVLGLKETEDRYYLLVKEPKKFREASMNCKLRGGTLAMPKTNNINRLMADYISQAGLTRVYVGVQTRSKDTDGTGSYIYADATPLQEFAVWSQEEQLYSTLSPATNLSCVELLNTGTWNKVECETALFFICEFPRSRRRGRGGTAASAS